jgi:hypothetical protein
VLLLQDQRIVLRRRSAAEQEAGATEPSKFSPKESFLPALLHPPERYTPGNPAATVAGCACSKRCSSRGQPAAQKTACFQSQFSVVFTVTSRGLLRLRGGDDGVRWTRMASIQCGGCLQQCSAVSLMVVVVRRIGGPELNGVSLHYFAKKNVSGVVGSEPSQQ